MEAAPGWEIDSGHAWLDPAEGVEPAAVLLVLHDATVGRAGDLESLVGPIQRSGLAAVAPLRGECWWTDRLAVGESGPDEEQRLLKDTVRQVSARWGDALPIALLGFGAGGHGALRLAYKRAREFPIVAAWRPAIDCHQLIDRRMPRPDDLSETAVRSLAARYRDAEHCRQDSAVLHIHPLGWPRHQWFGCPPGDPWWEGCDRLRMKLSSLGVPHECEIDANAKTNPVNANDPAVSDRAVAWIMARLDEEARRVP